jgi:hypothetical protein
MKKILLLIIPVIFSLLMISYVSASWFDNSDYYDEHNFKTLYDYMQNQKEQFDNKKAYQDDYHHPKEKYEYYQMDVDQWLYQDDNSYIHDKKYNSYDYDKYDNSYYGDKIMQYNDYRQKQKEDFYVYVKPREDTKRKVIYKKEIKQMMCDSYKCYIEYKEYYQ